MGRHCANVANVDSSKGDMMLGRLLLIALMLPVLAGPVTAKSDFMEEFDHNYETLDLDLLNNDCEVAQISDFVYHKDVATFTFEEGTLYLLRYVFDRPTTAVFLGRGRAEIRIPSHLERQSLETVARDSLVREDFETCFIRMGDDFDLALRERFTFDTTQMGWRDFNAGAKKVQGEVFFKPTMWHTYDNYFQLLRSLYERRADGYFWIDFNRYVYSFDPNVPEEVTVAFEHEGGDVIATPGAVFQRQEKGIYDDTLMSRIGFSTTMLDRVAQVEMTGLDGKYLEHASTTVKVLVNCDSIRFVNLFLHHNLHLDTVLIDGHPADYKRRKDFKFIGMILPQYRFRGDTLVFKLCYHGKQYDHAMPWVENPQPTPHRYTFVTPKGYNYFMPGMGPVEEIDGGKQRFEVAYDRPFDEFYFHGYASGLDTVSVVTDIGMSLNFLPWAMMNKKYSDCLIPLDTFQAIGTDAFNFMSRRLSMPPGPFTIYVSPGGSRTMPGVISTPQIACVREGANAAFGGFLMVAGPATARLWFGPLMQPATDREVWLGDALPEYLTLLFIQSSLGPAFYSNLNYKQDLVHTIVENRNDLPLAVGARADLSIRTYKGLWLLHMLRMLMYDLESKSDAVFIRFLQELVQRLNTRPFTNVDFADIAEKHYGAPLDWFFDHWLYDTNYPEFDVAWEVNRRDDGYYVEFDVQVDQVDPDFRMPIIMRVAFDGDQSSFARRTVMGEPGNYELGPFDLEPKELVFGEYFSVLGKSSVNRR